MAQKPKQASPFKKILNPNTKGLPRETFEHLYPEQKTITIPRGLRGVTKPARSTPMQKRRKAIGPAKPYRTYKKQEGGLLEKIGKGIGNILSKGTPPKDQVGKGQSGTISGKIMPQRKSVKEQEAAKRDKFFKDKAFPAGSTEGNPYGSKTKSTAKKGDTFGAKKQSQFPKTKGAYTIKKGDTLSSIAKARGTTVAAILKANPGIKDKNKIRAGAGLKGIPGIQGSSTIKNIADAGPKGKSFPVGTKFGELYKGKGKKKASGKVRAGRGTTGDRGNQTETATKKKSTPGLKGRKQRREKRNFNLGGMASMSSMDDYMKDLL